MAMMRQIFQWLSCALDDDDEIDIAPYLRHIEREFGIEIEAAGSPDYIVGIWS